MHWLRVFACTPHTPLPSLSRKRIQRAPSAVKAVRTFAQKTMGTKKVLLDPSVNSAIWGNGIKSVPHRIRVRLHRKRNDNDDAPADEKLYTQVSVVNVTEFKVRLRPRFRSLSSPVFAGD